VSTAYSLALGVIVPVSGWLGKRFEMGRVYAWSVFAFGATSALCGPAWHLHSEIAFRILRAIPGGILPVITLTMLYRLVLPSKIRLGMAARGVAMVFAPATGPTLGGYLVEYFSWRWIFYVNVPIAILGAIAAVLVLPHFPSVRAGRFDVLGFLTVATGLSALLVALSEGQLWGWGSYKILVLLTVSVLSLALFVVTELEVAEPLLDVRIFRHWAFTNSLLLISVLSIGLFAVLFYIPLLLQMGKGLAPFPAGLVLLPQALVLAVLTPISGRLYERIGPRWLAVIGLLIVAVSTYQMRQITLDASTDQISWLLVFRALGLGLCLIPVFTSGIASLPLALVPQASAINNLIRQTSSA
ncbi:MAG: DHA2 family efflux MFS transporter permease subunit, partial [Pseudonocardiaceae bacterium]